MAGGTLLNAMTVDVEDWFHVQALSSAIHRDTWHTREYRVEANTDRLLQLFAEGDVKCTFFVLGWVAERSPQLLRRIMDQGHELACHGYSHRLVYDQTVAEFREETMRSRRLIEDAAGCRVVGYRAATYSITRESMWALDVLAELGFQYDSSVFPVRHDTYGVPNADRFPSRMTTGDGRNIIEFPMTTARFFGVTVPVCGGGYFRLLPYWLIKAGLRQAADRNQQPFVFYLHPWEVDPAQPRIRTSWLSRLRHYTNLERTEARLRRLVGEFRFGTMRASLSQLDLLDPIVGPGADFGRNGAPSKDLI